MHIECVVCSAFCMNYICDLCREDLILYKKCAFCAGKCFCKYNSYVLFEYKSVKNLILQLKYSKRCIIADMFAYLAKDIFFNFNKDTIWTCIPTSVSKIVSRGYNTSLILCKSFCNIFGGSVNPFIFENTYEYVGDKISTIERQISVSSMYLNDKNINFNTNICIVDDVVASGSTLQQAIRLLEPYMLNISCIAIAKR